MKAVRRSTVILAALTCLSTSGLIRGQCHGNGGLGRLETSLLAAGTTVETRVLGGAGAAHGVVLSPAIAPTTVSGLGVVCLDLTAPGITQIFSGNLPPSGVAIHAIPIPNTAPWLALTLFGQGLVADPGMPSGFALTNTLRYDFEPPNSFAAIVSAPQMRAGATASRIPDRGWVLVCGGTSQFASSCAAPLASTEIYYPLARAFGPGPAMSVARWGHASATLADGRVFVAGGWSGSSILASCEVFDPATAQFQPAAPMTLPRLDHSMAVLDDGRVLVVGGTGNCFMAVGANTYFGSIHATGEIYDPATDAWTPIANTMQSPRVATSSVKLADGRILIISGYNGDGLIFGIGNATTTPTCDFFDPATNLFAPAPSFPATIPPRGEARATLRPNGEVFVSGGGLAGLQYPTDTTAVFDGTTWMPGPTAPRLLRQHQQALLPNGEVFICGGDPVIGSAGPAPGLPAETCLIYSGLANAVMPAATLSVVRYAHTLTVLNDGALLIAGGMSPIPLGNGFNPEGQIYTP